ncbi:MAG: undecaprenyl-diphosphate phosphatase [Patescibacteria group bacterium]|nr:undecaprenyl-diphosphate phosphatase [Patescibacteria group bacterium]
MIIYFLKSIILGIVQGFTEFLPISSTAHLILSVNLLKLDFSEFIKSFIIIIQFASILAVIILYWKKIWSSWENIKKIIIAFIPTAILGLLFYKIVKNFLQESLDIIALALFLGGVIMLFLEKRYIRKMGEATDVVDIKDIKDISYQQCFFIGIFQALAMIPGVSRSAATILGGLSMGISRLAIVEFSFLLAIPTMLAASSLDLIKTGFNFSFNDLIFLIIGFIVSFIVAWFSIKFLLKFIKKNDFRVFAWYRIILGVIIFLFLYT